jgi:hypothetical protein
MLRNPDARHGVTQVTAKHDLRDEIEEQVRAFLERGGAVKAVAPGISGRDQTEPPPSSFRSFTPRPREERTYVPEVVAAIEARRRKPKQPKRARTAKPTVVRRPVLDDFGEPVRYEWVEQKPG